MSEYPRNIFRGARLAPARGRAVTYGSLSNELLPADILSEADGLVMIDVKVRGRTALTLSKVPLIVGDEGRPGTCF